MQRLAFAVLLLLSVSITSCLELDAVPTLYDTYVDIWVRDPSGKSLLDPNIEGHFDRSQIRIFYVIDGDSIEVIRPRQDHPRNFAIIEEPQSGRFVFRVLPDEGTQNNEETITLIEWAPGEVDNLRCLIGRSEQAVFTRKIWYNDNLRFDIDNPGGSGRFIDVIKTN